MTTPRLEQTRLVPSRIVLGALIGAAAGNVWARALSVYSGAPLPTQRSFSITASASRAAGTRDTVGDRDAAAAPPLRRGCRQQRSRDSGGQNDTLCEQWEPVDVHVVCPVVLSTTMRIASRIARRHEFAMMRGSACQAPPWPRGSRGGGCRCPMGQMERARDHARLGRGRAGVGSLSQVNTCLQEREACDFNQLHEAAMWLDSSRPLSGRHRAVQPSGASESSKHLTKRRARK